MITVTSEEAQTRLAELLNGIDAGPVTITRAGRPDALLITATEIDDWADARWRNEAAAEFEAWKRDAEKELTPAAAELTDEEINRLVHDLR
jgi:prevent-host-death family protein